MTVLRMTEPLAAEIVGAKAATLGRLASAGFRVPPFIALAPEGFAENGLQDPASLSAALTELGAGPFAVRSSAAGEDGATSSHAGQLESLLNIPAEGVAAAAHTVWRSGLSERIRAYRAAMGLPAPEQGAAVIVQAMIAPKAAGIAFSADPVTGATDQIVVAAIEGLGDSLASGEASGSTYRLDRGSGDALVFDRSGPLSPNALAQIGRLATDVEAELGTPQDIEWAIDEAGLHLLQARPITTLERAEEERILDNSNIVESYPGLVTPLTFTFARFIYAHVYRALMRLLAVPQGEIARHGEAFDTLLAEVQSRVYYDLLNWYRMLALLPGFRQNRKYMETMMGVDEPLPESLVERIEAERDADASKFRTRLRQIRIAIGLVWQALTLKGRIRRFEARLAAALGDEAVTEDASAADLAAAYRRLEAALLERWDAPLVNDLICMIAFGASRNYLQKHAGDEGLRLHADALVGQGDIISAEPARMIREMGDLVSGDAALIERLAAGDRAAVAQHPDLEARFAAFLERFGDRCAEELKLESLPLTEEPTSLLAAIAAAAQRPAKAAQHAADPEERLGALFARRPFRRWVARRLLGWARARVRDRENLRFERTRLFGQVRRILRGIGRRLAEQGRMDGARDVFLLSIHDALALAEGDARDPRPMIATARDRFEQDSRFPDPPARIGGGARPAIVEGGQSRDGIACSSGLVQAPARVIRDPRRETLGPGEVLVARHTDPGWISHFANASAVVVERGSLLSHSAIVAREMGIPCVVGLKGACGWIATGDMLAVDGGAGRVTRLDG